MKDLPNFNDNLTKFKEKLPDRQIFAISAFNNDGLEEVINNLQDLVLNTKDEVLFDTSVQEKHVLYKFKQEKPFNIVKENNAYIITGDQVEKLFQMTNFNTDEAYYRFANKLRHMGIDDELEKMGIQEGDIVKIMDYEFEYTK